MEISVVVFTISVLEQEYPVWANLFQKIKLSVYFENWYLINSNMQNSMGCFILSVLDLKDDFGKIFQIKIVSLSLNLVLRLIPISDFGVSTEILNPVDISCR